ncbi:MAG: LysM peptidoglycan-binding domain-containing M23 family metallopeptidase [Patescibacteria group bacterium]
MSNPRIFYFLLKLLLAILNGTILLKNAAHFFVFIILGKPLQRFLRFFAKHFLISPYKLYLRATLQIRDVFVGSKNFVWTIMTTRYVIHATVILATIAVTTNSISARDLELNDIGQGSVVADVMDVIAGETVVKATDALLTPASEPGEFTSAIVANTPVLDPTNKISSIETSAITEQGALIKPNLNQTTTGSTQNGDIIEHIVQENETISEIAETYGVSVDTLLYANDLDTRGLIKAGQKLVVLPWSGVIHEVKSGDSLDALATKYGISVEDIMEENALVTADAIIEGQKLSIPGGKIPEIAEPPKPTRRIAEVHGYFSPSAPPSSAATGSWIWPTTSRRISQYFGRFHTGLDIDGHTGDPIYASRSGRVISAGWNRGYGISVDIDHGGGVTSRYGHNSKLFVKPGQYVNQGQTIALQGNTGRSTGDHVHMEIRINGRVQNPLSYVRR